MYCVCCLNGGVLVGSGRWQKRKAGGPLRKPGVPTGRKERYARSRGGAVIDQTGGFNDGDVDDTSCGRSRSDWIARSGVVDVGGDAGLADSHGLRGGDGRRAESWTGTTRPVPKCLARRPCRTSGRGLHERRPFSYVRRTRDRWRTFAL